MAVPAPVWPRRRRLCSYHIYTKHTHINHDVLPAFMLPWILAALKILSIRPTEFSFSCAVSQSTVYFAALFLFLREVVSLPPFLLALSRPSASSPLPYLASFDCSCLHRS